MNDDDYERARREFAARMEEFGYIARGDVDDRDDSFWNTVEAYPESYPQFPTKKEKRNMSGYDAGHAFASALGEMFQAKPGISYSKVVNVARKFAAWEGYRGLEDGLEYINGFVDGFFSAQPKQITEKAE